MTRDLEEEPKQKESDKPKIQYQKKPNNYLLDKIDFDIKNQKDLQIIINLLRLVCLTQKKMKILNW